MSRLDLFAVVAVLAVALVGPSCGAPAAEHDPEPVPEPVIPAEQPTPDIAPAPGPAEPLEAVAAVASDPTPADDLAAVLHGAVLDTDGHPVAGAAVTLVWNGDDPPTTTSGPDGLFVLPVPDGRSAFGAVASHPHHASEQRQLLGDVWSGEAPLFFHLSPLALVSGRVLDGAGAPLAGARVAVEPGGKVADTAYLRGTLDEARCDERGRFELRLPRRRVVRAQVRLPQGDAGGAGDSLAATPNRLAGGRPPDAEFVRALDDRPEQQWLLPLPARGALELTVRVDPEQLEAADLPVDVLAGAQVVAALPGTANLRPESRPPRVPLTDGRARFDDLELGRGRDLVLMARGFQPAVLAFGVVPTGPLTELTVDLPALTPRGPREPRRHPSRAHTWQLRWTLVDTAGRQLDSLEVRQRLPSNGQHLGRAVITSQVTGEEATVTLEHGGGAHGWFSVSVEAPVRVEFQLGERVLSFSDVTADTPLQVVVEPLGQLVDLRPVDEHGRLVLCLYHEVTGPDGGGRRRLVLTEVDGHAQVDLLPGRYVVRPQPLYGQPATVHRIDVPVPRADGVVELPIPAGAALSGAVLPPPAPDEVLSLVVEDRSVPGAEARHGASITADGRFELAGLPAGPVRLGLWRRGTDGARALVAVRELTLEPGRLHEVELVRDREPAGRPLRITSVTGGVVAGWVRPDDDGPGMWWDGRRLGETLRLAPGRHHLRYTVFGGGPGDIDWSELTFEVVPGEGVQEVLVP